MSELKLITVALSRQADWKLRLTQSGSWITARNASAPSGDSTRIYYRPPENLPEASEETLQILEELGIE